MLHCAELGTVVTVVPNALSVRLCVGEWLKEDDFEVEGAVNVLTDVTLTVVMLTPSVRLFGIGEWLMEDDFGTEGIVKVLTSVTSARLRGAGRWPKKECFGVKVGGKESSRLVKLV